MRWLLIAVIVVSTVFADLLQSREMKDMGEVDDFRPGSIKTLLTKMARRTYLIVAVIFMAISFFAFVKLLEVADLSFAVPASAASVVIETLLAKVLLHEQVDARRWAGAGMVACGVILLAL